jgi:hypothetical protein
MKLNLLPTTVSKGQRVKVAAAVAAAIVFASLGAAVFMSIHSANQYAQMQQQANEIKPTADLAVQVAQHADTIMGQAQGIIRNTNLATAMIAHNQKYPALYDTVFRYIPRFFRVTNVSATPSPDGETVTVVMSGLIGDYQQYADLMLALLRIPDAQGVGRGGFALDDPVVPALTGIDQTGRVRRMGEAPIPDDPLARMEQMIAGAGTTGFEGIGNFGQPGREVRGAMPGRHQVTVSVVIANRDLRVPAVAQTLAAGGGAPAAGVPAAAPTMPGMMPGEDR